MPKGLKYPRTATCKDLPEDHRYDLNVADIRGAGARRGSVVGSWLLDLTAMALVENPALTEYTGFVPRFGRRALDCRRRSRRSGPGRRAHLGTLHAVPVPPGAHVRGEDPVCDAGANSAVDLEPGVAATKTA